MNNKMDTTKVEYISVDLGYGYVKAMSSSGKTVIFPALVGEGYESSLGSNVFGNTKNDIENIQVKMNDKTYFVGKLAADTRSATRIYDQERYTHTSTQVLINVAIQLVSDVRSDVIRLMTGLPLDFYGGQAENFKKSLIGVQPNVEWITGPLAGKAITTNVENSLVFPQGAAAIFSALINHEGRYVYPQIMEAGNVVALIDIGFRTTDFVVVEIQEDGSFRPKTLLCGSFDQGVNDLREAIKQHYKEKSGGVDIADDYVDKAMKNKKLPYKGQMIQFDKVIEDSKISIANSIADRLNQKWKNEVGMFLEIFLAGGGGLLFESALQTRFDNRLKPIKDSQFANAIGYLRLGKSVLEQEAVK